MKYLFTLPLAVAAFLVACDSGSTAPDPYIKGDLIYERHIDPNEFGSMQCKVYATDDVITVESSVNLMGDNSYIEILESNFGKNPATFRGEYNMSGKYLMYSEQTCEGAKEDIAKLENQTISCSSNKVSFTSTMPQHVNETSKNLYIFTLKSEMKSDCDEMYEEIAHVFAELSSGKTLEDLLSDKEL